MADRPKTCSSIRGVPSWFAPTLSLLPAALFTSCGIYCLCLDAFAENSQVYRASGGLLLLLSGGVQLWIHRQLRVKHKRQSARSTPIQTCRGAKRGAIWLAAGVFTCYVIMLSMGSGQGDDWLFLSGTAAWYTLIIWLRLVPSGTATLCHRINQLRVARLAMLVSCTVMIVLVTAEVGLRICDWTMADRLSANFIVHRIKPAPGSRVFEQAINAQGFAGDDFQVERTPGIVRIAVLGDELAASGCRSSNYLQQLDRQLPGVEIYNFAVPQAGPRENLALWSATVAQYDPDLVICFVSVADDIHGQSARPGFFDWQSLRLGQFASQAFSSEPAPREFAIAPADESLTTARFGHQQAPSDYLEYRGRQLSVCRTPMDAQAVRRWREMQRDMHRLAEHCQRQKVPLGVVLIPGDFQINNVLLSTLRRRLGYDASAIDIELPQRQFARIVERQGFSVLDLLPRLRESSTAAFCHNQNQLSHHGNAVVADAVGQWLERCYGGQIAALTRQPTLLTAEVRSGGTRR